MGGAVGASFGAKSTRAALIGAVAAALLVGLIAFFLPFGHNLVAVQGYGVMILIGFVSAILLAQWHVPQIGLKPHHVIDMGLTGCFLGIAGARVFYVLMNWNDFSPFTSDGFQAAKIAKMFFIWEGGLVFYGAFLTAIPSCYYYCKRNNVPVLPFMDICGPGLILGQAFGRIGCFLTGCCYGRSCNLPWAVTFPGRSPELPGAPVFEWQVQAGEINAWAARSHPVHPTQLYAAIAGFLTYAFLMLYWRRRKYDGQILALMLIMAGTTRFFEEMLRNDDAPPLPGISDSITIAQWLAIPIVLTGFGLMFYFRKKNTLYVPPAALESAVAN